MALLTNFSSRLISCPNFFSLDASTAGFEFRESLERSLLDCPLVCSMELDSFLRTNWPMDHLQAAFWLTFQSRLLFSPLISSRYLNGGCCSWLDPGPRNVFWIAYASSAELIFSYASSGKANMSWQCLPLLLVKNKSRVNAVSSMFSRDFNQFSISPWFSFCFLSCFSVFLTIFEPKNPSSTRSCSMTNINNGRQTRNLTLFI